MIPLIVGQKKADISRLLSVSGILLERGDVVAVVRVVVGYGVEWVREAVRGVPLPF